MAAFRLEAEVHNQRLPIAANGQKATFVQDEKMFIFEPG
jgi:hypothetical protein